MLQFFRNFFNSKVGVGATLTLVGLIALAFAGGDIASGGAFGAFTKGERLATVGKDKINLADADQDIKRIFDNIRQDNPQMTMAQFLERAGFDNLLTFLIDRRATYQFGRLHGIEIGDRLIDREIVRNQAVLGLDGKVDPKLLKAYLGKRGISEGQYREELAQQLMAKELLGPVATGNNLPQKVLLRYAGVAAERRRGAIITLPAAAFAPKAPPSEGEIGNWYGSHKAAYALPERRTVRYVVFSTDALKNVPAPSDTEVAARYNANKAKYAAANKRKLVQLVLPSEAAAKQVQSEVAAGKSLETVAAGKGLSVAQLGSLTQDAYAVQSSGEVANAVFAAAKGKVLGPLKAPLGWMLVRIDAVETVAGKTLDQARPELLKELGEEKRKLALADFTGGIEDKLSEGAGIADIAKQLGLTVSETPELTADGAVYGKAGASAPAELAKIIPNAFAAESAKEAQFGEVEPGKSFIVFDVGHIAASAAPPLAEIRDRVIMDVQLSKGSVLAKAAAEKVQAQIQKGVSAEAAVASLGLALPPVDHVDKTRPEVQAMGQNTPRPVMLLFAMGKGKVRVLGGRANHNFYVVTVSEVIPGVVDPADPKLAKLRDNLKQSLADEYAGQLRSAMRGEVGVTRNAANETKLQAQLAGAQQ